MAKIADVDKARTEPIQPGQDGARKPVELTENKTEQPERKSWLRENYLFLLLLIFVAIPLTFVVIVVSRSAVDIGTPATEQDALIRSNERLLQMAQWTIGTVLTLGVAYWVQLDRVIQKP